MRQAYGRLEVFQCAIDQQLAQLRQLLEGHRHAAVRTLQLACEVSGHDVQGGEGFAGVAEQGLGVDVGEDGEDVADESGLLLIVLTEGRDVFIISLF